LNNDPIVTSGNIGTYAPFVATATSDFDLDNHNVKNVATLTFDGGLELSVSSNNLTFDSDPVVTSANIESYISNSSANWVGNASTDLHMNNHDIDEVGTLTIGSQAVSNLANDLLQNTALIVSRPQTTAINSTYQLAELTNGSIVISNGSTYAVGQPVVVNEAVYKHATLDLAMSFTFLVDGVLIEAPTFDLKIQITTSDGAPYFNSDYALYINSGAMVLSGNTYTFSKVFTTSTESVANQFDSHLGVTPLVENYTGTFLYTTSIVMTAVGLTATDFDISMTATGGDYGHLDLDSGSLVLNHGELSNPTGDLQWNGSNVLTAASFPTSLQTELQATQVNYVYSQTVENVGSAYSFVLLNPPPVAMGCFIQGRIMVTNSGQVGCYKFECFADMESDSQGTKLYNPVSSATSLAVVYGSGVTSISLFNQAVNVFELSISFTSASLNNAGIFYQYEYFSPQ
jgi:hypothetical protein